MPEKEIRQTEDVLHKRDLEKNTGNCPEEEPCVTGEYSYLFLRHHHLMGIAYALILAARLCRLWIDPVSDSLLWWLDTVILAGVVLMLNGFSGRKRSHLKYSETAVVLLTAFHIVDLVFYIVLSAGRGHVSWHHMTVIVLFTIFSVAPTIFLLWCDTHQHIPKVKVLHTVTFVRIVILTAEAGIYLMELLYAERHPHHALLILSIVLTIAGHILYEGALSYLVKRLHHSAEEAATGAI